MSIQYNNDNKRIAINTIIIYVRMVIGALIGLFTTRYVLAALGVSDYGLYNVVGGAVTMLNFISIGMHTTTRRYINVEMGKLNGDVSKIFNVCLVLHIGFALFIYLLAITVGLWYVGNVLNVSPEKLSDARFVYIISTTVSAIGIINVPYQALLTAYERFRQIAFIDIINSLLKIPLVMALLVYTGNHLRFYAIGICLMTIFSLLLYSAYCYCRFPDTVKWQFCKNKNLYKEIMVFNNYTALGAFAFLARSQGSTMVINYFFGTLVNGAFAIALQIETQLQSYVGNLTIAATPQMTQNYSAGNFQRSFDIVCSITRFCSLIMAILSFSIFVSLEPLLSLWLKNIPSGTLVLCQVMLLSLFLRSLGSGVDGLIQATGQVEQYQIIQSTLLILGIPLSIILFLMGFSPVFILYAFIVCDIIRTLAMYVIICRITPFDIRQYMASAYKPVVKVIVLYIIYYVGFQFVPLSETFTQLSGFVITLFYASLVSFFFGISKSERSKVTAKVLGLFQNRTK